MKVCVLQPDYGSSQLDYRHYDPPRNLAPLLPTDRVDHVFIHKLSTYRQLKALRRQGYDIFINLCEGYLDWDIPSIDVVHAMELLGMPFTGPSSRLYDPSKALMKYVAYAEGVPTPAAAVVRSVEETAEACRNLPFPLFVKPARAGDSLGIDRHSLVHTADELADKTAGLIGEYEEVLIEQYIDGREFTVLVAAHPEPEQPPLAYRPLEFVFPEGEHFKTYELKIQQYHPECNVPCTDPDLDARLREAARRVFRGFGGAGYARLDFRVNDRGELFFLEINFTCSVFYPDGFKGSADYILEFDGIGQPDFLRHIIAEGIARHGRRQKLYELKGNAIAGYGIYARRAITAGELIYQGEERAQRIVTRGWVESRWSPEQQESFRRYAYPLGPEIYALWDENPEDWAPQNHSCDANTGFRGLNVYALRDIAPGEELTLDYATFLDETMEPFECCCGAGNCRGVIRGK